ncbi:MAG: alcohol dehydrogenase [Chloroflexi bacterium]|nr:MAG: alcohol dehydrogenase [Chloroflexota bacterium]MBL1193228.1 alcohol dehydrogenase [Chloroflexota bacterium]NOH10523.1 alcohol dehydrogenase catalytic domain-containing protein [Chloroflexota bacterium]
MKAIQFNASVPRYALGLALSRIYTPLLWSGLSCTFASDVPEPELPGPDWVKLRTRYGGICGTDLSAIHLHTSPYYSPFTSSPFTLGHENMGTIAELGSSVSGWQVGERVIIEPTLWCEPRGFAEDDCCEYCAEGIVNQCQRTTEGDLAPGLSIGVHKETGGSWSSAFVAHTSQLYRVPAEISDENALMVEPFACGLHAALNYFPQDDDTVLIVGAGTIGLVTLAALRALGSKAEILISARYDFQAQAAERLGASQVLRGKDLYQQLANHMGASIHQPIIGKPFLVGGPQHTFECSGSDGGLDDAIRVTRSGGQLVIVGVPGIAKGVDWAPIFDKELKLNAAYIYDHAERWQGQTWKTYDLTIDLMQRGLVDLGWMVTHRYALDDYSQALRQHGDKRNHEIIKAVFEFKE